VAEKWSLGPFQGPNEELAFKHLAENLPDDWFVIANRQLDTPKREEVDLIVLGKNNLFLLEEKSWGPTVIYGDVRWSVINKIGRSSERKSPFIDISTKARITSSWLRDNVNAFSTIKRHSVIDAVLMTHPQINLQPRVGAHENGKIFTLAESVTWLMEYDSKNFDGIFKDLREPILRLLVDYVQRDLRILKFADYKVKSRLTPADDSSGIIVFEAENAITGVEYHLLCVDSADEAGDKLRRNYSVARELQPRQRSWNNAGPFWDNENDLIVYPFEKPEGAISFEQLGEEPNMEIFELYSASLNEILLDGFTALDELAQSKILHRTLCPSRIWVTRGLKIVFTDFRNSHLGGDLTVGVIALDATSLDYRAPECSGNLYLAQEKSDLYSLAASASKVFGLNLLELEDEANNSDSVQKVLRDCLYEDVNNRPTAHEAAERIKQLISPDPVVEEISIPAEDQAAPVSALETALIARRFGDNYEVQEKLGFGGTGTSWLARYESDDEVRLMVIKEARDGVAFEVLNREYANSHKISPHPRCSRGFEVRRDPKPGAIVNTYMGGMTLKKYLDISNLPLEDVESVFISALEILDHIHDQGYIHGDISANNILVDESLKTANLIDFGDLRPFGPITSEFGTRNSYAPEIANLKEVSSKTDIYSLSATFIHLLLGRSHRFIDRGDTEEGFERRPMLDEEKLQFGPEYSDFLEILFEAINIDVSQRPNSPDLRQRILARKTAQRRVPVIGLKNQVNPYVDRIRSLITSSSAASSGAIAELAAFSEEDKLFYDLTYIETGLETKLLPRIVSGEKRVILLTGNPGGGKTSFLYTVKDRLLNKGGKLETEKNEYGNEPEWSILYEGRKFHAVLDASQSDGPRSANQVVESALKSAFEKNGVALIAINDGRLKQFASRYEEEFPDFARAVDAYFANEDIDGEYIIVDLKNRSVVDLSGKGLILDSIETLSQDSLWAKCIECALQDICPINDNRKKIKQNIPSSRIAELTLETYLRRNERPNFRRIRSALGYLITGDETCDDIAAKADSGELDFESSRLHNLAFKHKSGDLLIDSWNGYDPALRISPKLRLNISSRIQENSAAEFVESIYRTYARKTFFGEVPDLYGEIVPEISPYSFLNLYREYLSGFKSDIGLILQGLSRLSGVHMPYRKGLSVSEVSKGTGWAVIKLIPESEFSLRVDRELSDYFDTTPESLTLLHEKTNLSFRMNVDAFEMIARAAQGEIFNDFETGAIRFELAAFGTRLLRSPVFEAFLMDPSGSYSRVDLEAQTISLHREKVQNEV
jgi:serine/threonine protein kinase